MGQNSSFLDPLLSPTIQDDGTSLTRRANVNYIGFTVEDNPTDGSTDITNTGGATAIALDNHASFRALSSEPADGQIINFQSPPDQYVYKRDVGAGIHDNDSGVLKLTSVSLGSNGRAFLAHAPLGIANVVFFGAVGDGSIADRVAIQAAIDAMPAVNGSLYFPPSRTYLLDSTYLTLVGKDNASVYSDGPGAKIQMVIDTIGIAVYNCHDLEMFGLDWIGTLQEDGGDPTGLPGRIAPSNVNQSAVLVSQSRGFNIHDMQWHDLGGYALFTLDYVFDVKGTNLRVIRTQAGIQTAAGLVAWGDFTFDNIYMEGNVWQTPDIPSGRSWGSDDQMYFASGLCGRLKLSNITIDKQGFIEANQHVLVSVNTSNGNLVTERHGYTVGKTVRFRAKGDMPTGLVAERTYYVRAVIDSITFRVSETPSSAVIVPSDDGSGSVIVYPVNDGSSNQSTALDFQVCAADIGGDNMADVILSNITLRNVRSTRTTSHWNPDLRQDAARPPLQFFGDLNNVNKLLGFKMSNVVISGCNCGPFFHGPGIEDVSVDHLLVEDIWALAGGTHSFVEEDGFILDNALGVSMSDVTIKGAPDFAFNLAGVSDLHMHHVKIFGKGVIAKTVTPVNATDVFNCANHNFLRNDPVKITSTGSNPTGIGSGKYYVIQGSLTDLEFKDKFQLSASINGSAVTFSDDGSGVITATYQINDVGGGNAGFNLTSCHRSTISDSSCTGVSTAARIISCTRTKIHDTHFYDNAAYIQLLISGGGTIHDNDQHGNTSTDITDSSGGTWHKYNNTIDGGTDDQVDFTGTIKLDGLSSGVVHSVSGVLASSAIVDADITGPITVTKVAPGTSGQILRSNSTPLANWCTAGGDVSGDPTSFVVGGLTGLAGVVTIGASTRLEWASGPKISKGGLGANSLVFTVPTGGNAHEFFDASNLIGDLVWNGGNTVYQFPAAASSYTIQGVGTGQYFRVVVDNLIDLDADDIYFKSTGSIQKGRFVAAGLRIGTDGASARERLDLMGRAVFDEVAAPSTHSGAQTIWASSDDNHFHLKRAGGLDEFLDDITYRGADLTNAAETLAPNGGNRYVLQPATLVNSTAHKTLGTPAAQDEVIILTRLDTTANTMDVKDSASGLTIYQFPVSQKRLAAFKYDTVLGWLSTGHAQVT